MSREADDRAVQILIAEFQFVAGLIPFYRRAELVVLGATGALVSVIVAALATLEAAEEGKRQAEGILLVLGSWVPVLLLLIEVMALMRIARASRYIDGHLRQIASELGGSAELLKFEHSPGVELFEVAARWRRRDAQQPRSDSDSSRSDRSQLSFLERRVLTFFSSMPLILVISLTAVTLAVGGIVVDMDVLTLSFGIPAIGSALVLGSLGISFTKSHEGRNGATIPSQDPPVQVASDS